MLRRFLIAAKAFHLPIALIMNLTFSRGASP
jgi:hypothetical protein